jgi:hypothetical protein
LASLCERRCRCLCFPHNCPKSVSSISFVKRNSGLRFPAVLREVTLPCLLQVSSATHSLLFKRSGGRSHPGKQASDPAMADPSGLQRCCQSANSAVLLRRSFGGNCLMHALDIFKAGKESSSRKRKEIVLLVSNHVCDCRHGVSVSLLSANSDLKLWARTCGNPSGLPLCGFTSLVAIFPESENFLLHPDKVNVV